MRPGRSIVLLLACAILLPGCGTGPAPESGEVQDRVRWRAGDEPPAQGAEAHRSPGLLRLAQAPAAGVLVPLRPPPEGEGITVALWSNGDWYTRGSSSPLSDPRGEAFLGRELRMARARRGRSWLELLVDASRTWGEVVRVVALAQDEPPPAPRGVTFTLRCDDVAYASLALEFRPGSPTESHAAAVLRLDVIDAGGGTAPRVQLGDRSWQFPAGDPYARGPSLDRANAAWVAIRAALASAAPDPRGGDSTARVPSDAPFVSIDPQAPWPHVVQLLALAHDAGWRRLRIDSLASGAELGLSSPPDRPLVRRWRVGVPSDPLAPEPRDPRDLTPLAAVVIGTALAAAVVFGPAALRRRP